MKVRIGDIIKDNDYAMLYVVEDVYCGKFDPNSTHAYLCGIKEYPYGFSICHIQLNTDNTILYPGRWEKVHI